MTMEPPFIWAPEAGWERPSLAQSTTAMGTYGILRGSSHDIIRIKKLFCHFSEVFYLRFSLGYVQEGHISG